MPPELDDLVRDLNDAQREAVLHEDGPLLVVAGPGSGKTRVVSRRVAALVRRGVPAHSILAVTFTNRAAGELRERVERLVPAAGLWVATFHAACATILRRYGGAVGLPRHFSIYDEEDRSRLAGRVLRELPGAREQLKRGDLVRRISRWKNAGAGPERAAAEARMAVDRMAAQAYERYERLLREQAAADFDDLLVLVARLLEDHGDVAAALQGRLRHVLVDEYQDTNAVQYRIARALAAGTNNLCATGDPDQSIYGWRGADIRNILDFREHYPDARIVRLERNYRSVRSVLDAASALIRHNRDRHEKDLLTDAADGAPVRVVQYDDSDAEGDGVARGISEFVRGGRSPREAAVLYRVNARSRAVETALRLRGLPYQVVRGVEFFQRAEVKDLVAWLRLLVNPADVEAALRVLQAPARGGVGDATAQRLLDAAAAAAVPVRDILAAGPARVGITGRAAGSLERVATDLRAVMEFRAAGVGALLDEILHVTGYREWIAQHWPDDAPERNENVDELLVAARRFDEAAAAAAVAAGDPTAEADARAFLEQVALVSDQDRYDDDAPRVTLMSLHAAKGLEFAAVWIIGVEEGLLPHARSEHSAAALEEERRLLFVGMTRAKERLELSAADRGLSFGAPGMGGPSRFLHEAGRAVERLDRRTRRADGYGGGWGGRGRRGGGGDDDGGASYDDFDVPPREAAADPPRAPWVRRAVAAAGADAPPRGEGVDLPPAAAGAVGIREGDRVRHATFGEGKVRRVERRGSSVRVTVEFRMGLKTLDLAYARLDRPDRSPR